MQKSAYYCVVKKTLFRALFMGFIALLVSLNCVAQATKNKLKTTPVKSDVYQIISYEIAESGDTINRMDDKKRKQGKWLNVFEAHYGEEAYMEYGYYLHNTKVGTWQTFEMNGQIMSEENFKLGNKNGEAKYFENGKLYCVGNYLALNSKHVFDTIMVEDAITNIEKPMVIKTEIGSVKHGTWTYYNVATRKVERVIEFQADEIIDEKDYTTTEIDSTIMEQRKKVLPHVSNKPTMNTWQLDNGKKAPRFTEFPEDTKYVKPNVRKK